MAVHAVDGLGVGPAEPAPPRPVRAGEAAQRPVSLYGGHNSTSAGRKLADRAVWVVRAYEAAGEATIYRSDPGEAESDRVPIPESEEDKVRRARARAVKRVRLYGVSNGLTFLWTLTWAGSGPCGQEVNGWCGCGRPRSFVAALSTVPMVYVPSAGVSRSWFPQR